MNDDRDFSWMGPSARPPAPVVEHVLWTVTKDVRQHPHGQDLIYLIGRDSLWSQVFRPGDGRNLNVHSNPRPLKEPVPSMIRLLVTALLAAVMAATGQSSAQDATPLALTSEPGAYTHLLRWRHGVQPLSAALIPLALRANSPQGAYAPEMDPFMLRVALLNMKQIPPDSGLKIDSVAATEQAQKDFPYGVQIQTPFTRIAHAAMVARVRYGDTPKPNVQEENRRGVVVIVTPNGLTGTPIDRVLVKRGQAIIRPTRTARLPMHAQNGFGATFLQVSGIFEFAFSAFAPGGEPLSLVFVGVKDEPKEWPMHRRELEALR